jgi:hypothetical protein
MSGRIALIVVFVTFVSAFVYDAFEGRPGNYSPPRLPVTLLPAKSVATTSSGGGDSQTAKDRGSENIARPGAAVTTDTAENQAAEDCQQDETSFRTDKTAAKLLAAQAQVLERGADPEQLPVKAGCKPTTTEDVFGTPPY